MTIFWILVLTGSFFLALYIAHRYQIRKEAQKRAKLLRQLDCGCNKFEDSLRRFRLKQAIKDIERERRDGG